MLFLRDNTGGEAFLSSTIGFSSRSLRAWMSSRLTLLQSVGFSLFLCFIVLCIILSFNVVWTHVEVLACDVSALLCLPQDGVRLRLVQSSQCIQTHVCVLMFYTWEVQILSLFLT